MVHAFLMTHDNSQLQNTVLVIGCSDSPVTSVVSTVLSSWKLQRARDNDEALALVEKFAFDLVIADQASSGQEDLELLRKVRLARRLIRLASIPRPYGFPQATGRWEPPDVKQFFVNFLVAAVARIGGNMVTRRAFLGEPARD